MKSHCAPAEQGFIQSQGLREQPLKTNACDPIHSSYLLVTFEISQMTQEREGQTKRENEL